MTRTTQDPGSPKIRERARIGKLDQPENDEVSLVLADCYASDYLFDRFDEYVQGTIRGASILICGHRGSGKTTAINQAFVKTLDACHLKPSRPLLVNLPAAKIVIARNESTQERQKTLRAERAERRKQQREDADGEEGGDAAPPADVTPLEDLGTTLLKAISESLHQALTQEVYASMNEHVTRVTIKQDLVAELILMMDDPYGPTSEQLAAVWHEAKAQKAGVLFPRGDGALAGRLRPANQGAREMLAVASVCEAYRRVTGSYTLSTTQNDAESDDSSLTEETSLSFSGGLLNAIFGHSSKSMDEWKRKRALARSQAFEAPLNVETLSRELVKIFGRLKEAGLYPIFVWDGLDQITADVDDDDSSLTELFDELTQHLKAFFHEHVVFCFAADRKLYAHIREAQTSESYSPIFSSYRFAPFLCHSPEGMHEFLKRRHPDQLADPPPKEKSTDRPSRPVMPPRDLDIAEPEGVADDPDTIVPEAFEAEFLRRLILHRGRLHPLETTREADLLFRGPTQERPSLTRFARYPNYRFEFLVQLAAELALNSPPMRNLIDRDPRNLQLGIDAVYYISRQWKSSLVNKKVKVKFGRTFREAMRSRGREALEQIDVLERVARKVADFLADYQSLKSELQAYEVSTAAEDATEEIPNRPGQRHLTGQHANDLATVLTFLEAQGMNVTDYRFNLLLKDDETDTYEFLHTPSGPTLDWLLNAAEVVNACDRMLLTSIPAYRELFFNYLKTLDRSSRPNPLTVWDKATTPVESPPARHISQIYDYAIQLVADPAAANQPPESEAEYERMILLNEMAANIEANYERIESDLAAWWKLPAATARKLPRESNFEQDSTALIQWAQHLRERIDAQVDATLTFVREVGEFSREVAIGQEKRQLLGELKAIQGHDKKREYQLTRELVQSADLPAGIAAVCREWKLPEPWSQQAWPKVAAHLRDDVLPRVQQSIREYERGDGPVPAELAELQATLRSATAPRPVDYLRTWQAIQTSQHKARGPTGDTEEGEPAED